MIHGKLNPPANQPGNYSRTKSLSTSTQSSDITEKTDTKKSILQKIKNFRNEIIINTHKTIQSISLNSQTLLSELCGLELYINGLNESSLFLRSLTAKLTLKINQKKLDELIKDIVPIYMPEIFEIFEDSDSKIGTKRVSPDHEKKDKIYPNLNKNTKYEEKPEMQDKDLHESEETEHFDRNSWKKFKKTNQSQNFDSSCITIGKNE